ncbi:stage II sporulation protein M [Ornithobacterium rhinotracheale]|uniref:stage II sporulation protein M n=1 Tax=Ornithobacterium rhinotracheale TaxID=28251 RepID=UPI00129D0AB1|nr:stage II sporulation protein M [Ornithobacterium rhinotracheale]MRJ10220.1 stage II sporulation protein M [Ornithobacterium rhinotracheale]
MREVVFIKQNKEKWLNIEHVLLGKVKKNPDELSSLYIDLINDLSYAQTYYPKSKTISYLNKLSTKIYQKIYKTKRIEENQIKYFFLTEVPLLAYQYRRFLWAAVFFFVIFTTIGWFSAANDEEFVRLILGDGYVDMTIHNIEEGNPIAVYESGSNWGSAIGIIFNNLKVGATMFLYGIFLGIGSVLALFYNCIMLGSFQYFFLEYGELARSMRGIWIHGAFEISAMVIECMAGLILGASILFPRTYSRLNSFKLGFRDAFKIFMSTVPFTIVAGIFEGFVTRHALDMPLILNLIIIFGCFSFILFYYVYYPKKVYNQINSKL